MLGPDEPRYAAIGREMAHSGDWVTPRLWGQAWFEKPPLLYWMTAAGFCAGLNEDLAPRFGVAILSVAFLAFYCWTLGRAFGRRAAFLSTAILGLSAMWLVFGRVGVPDLPMTVAFSAAMLLLLPWIETGDRRGLVPAAALMGIAVVAKGLVPLVLALPLLWFARGKLRDLLRAGPAIAFAIPAVPWYVLATWRNGSTFLEEFLWKHHFERFSSPALAHVQPFWFYAAVGAAALFPWTPLLALPFRRKLYDDPRRRFLLVWFLFGLVFFSAARNKLPGYVLPLMPAACALLGIALAEVKRARAVLAGSAVLVAGIPVLAAILPEAMLRGVTHATLTGVPWRTLAVVGALAVAVWLLESAGRRELAVLVLGLAVAGGTLWMELRTFPLLDREVSARGIWREVAPRSSQACVGEVSRSVRYGLNYYSVTPLPDCADSPRPLRVEPTSR